MRNDGPAVRSAKDAGRCRGPVRRGIGWLLAAAAVAVAAASDAAAADVFDLRELARDGRTVAAELVDFDGDGLQDVMRVVFTGVPPAERRELRVHRQRADRSFSAEPDSNVPLPEGAAYFDLHDLLASAGSELLLVGRGRVFVGEFGRRGDEGFGWTWSEWPAPDHATITASPDERGLDRASIAVEGIAAGEAWVLLPGLGEAVLLGPDGGLRGRLQVGGRANYFVQPPGPTLAESEIQLFYDIPRVFVGDMNGDGLGDVVSSTRHEIRVFLQQAPGPAPEEEAGSGEDGAAPRPATAFLPEPSKRYPLALVDEEDHIRGSGSVRTDVRDMNGDGLLDLLITSSAGGIMSAESKSSIYFNRGSGWELERADQVYPVSGGLSADQIVDLDRDGRSELVQVTVPISIMEIVELLVTQSADSVMRVFRLDGDRREAVLERKFSIDIDFSTGRPAGFIPTFEHDLNADGHADLLTSGDGEEIEVYLGGSSRGFARRDARQSMDTAGRVRPGDLDGDALVDFVLYDPRRSDVPVVLLRNRGTLPGTPPQPPDMRSGG